MKKFTILMSLFALILMTGSAFAGPSKSEQRYISGILDSAGMKNGWPQDISLWVETRFTEREVKSIAEQICNGAGVNDFYAITFWRDIDVSKGAAGGEVFKYRCNY